MSVGFSSGNTIGVSYDVMLGLKRLHLNPNVMLSYRFAFSYLIVVSDFVLSFYLVLSYLSYLQLLVR